MDTKLPDEELTRQLAEAAKQVTIGAEYAHYKHKPYKVLNLAVREADNEICVVYQALYGAGLTWIRPLINWIETAEVDGHSVPRFTKA